MNPDLHPPSRILRWGSTLVRTALWLVGAVWLLAGLTLGLVHGVILPRLAQWTPELEALATKAIGISVRMGHVEAQRQGLLPVLHLKDLHLLDAQGRRALSLGEVVVVASVPSLWRLGVEQIHIDHPVLDIRRRADGVVEVAGMALSASNMPSGNDSPALDWVFSQSELVIRNGQLRWTDEWQRQPTLELEQMDVVLRNTGRRHQIRVNATPSHGLSGRLNWMADFRSPLLSLHPGRWLDWRGTVFAHLPAVNLAGVAAPTHLTDALDLRVQRGQGALRWWVDIDKGHIHNSTLDVAMTEVMAQFAHASAPLNLARAQGRLELSRKGPQWTLDVPQLQLTTVNGLQWQGDGLQAQWTPHDTDPAESTGRFHSGTLDLAALGALASALPFPPALLGHLEALQPSGQLDQLAVSWKGDAQHWSRFAAEGAGSRLSLRAAPDPVPSADGTPPMPQRPGFRDAGVRFQFNQDGGQAQLSMRQGELVFPGVFEESTLPISNLTANLQWTQLEHGPKVQFSQVKFANADAQGQMAGEWRPGDPASSPSGSRLPGILKLEGSLQHAVGNRVHRYLPLVISQAARHYVRDALLAGDAQNVQFKVHGDLWNMPFANPAHGDFRIAAKVRGADFAYIPSALQGPGAPTWPVLRKLDGDLVFERNGLSLSVAKGIVTGAPGLQVRSVKAQLPDYAHPVVEVQARIEGPLTEALGAVRTSPLASFTHHALDDAKGHGNTAIQFALKLPLLKLQDTTVKGQVHLRGNDLTLATDTPTLHQTRGTVEFSEQGFQIHQAKTQLGGGELQFDGDLKKVGSSSVLTMRGKGHVTAEGLRAETTLGPLAQLSRYAAGQADYQVGLTWDSTGPQWTVHSELEGLELNAPAPLNKPSAQRWPLAYTQNTRNANQSAIRLDMAAPQPVRVQLLQFAEAPTGPSWTGTVAIGKPDPASPPHRQQTGKETGLLLNINLPLLDADAWSDFLHPSAPSAATPSAGTLTDPLTAHMPQRIQLRVDQLKLAGQWLNQPEATLQRFDARWSGHIQAKELAGQFDYQPAQATGHAGTSNQRGRLQAKLRHLHVKTTDATAGGTSGQNSPTKPQRQELPALDLDIANLKVDERELGHLQLQASHVANAQQEAHWQLDQLKLTTPEAELTGTGSWKNTVPQGLPGHTATGKRTLLDFSLRIHDSDVLLQRFGMPGVLRGGQGAMTGQLSWQGPPHAFDTPSLSGKLHLDLGKGQFLKADAGMAKLLGVLSLQSLPRRLTLDFSDVFADGFAFDSLRGDAVISQGVARTDNLRMKGPHATVNLQGQADIGRETQDILAEVLPEINAGTASLLASVVNPVMGLSTLLAQTILRTPLSQATKQEFHIHGTWSDPVVDRIRSTPLPPP